MGGIGRAIAAVATGGLSEVARQVLPQDTYNTVSSIASGGISDIVERNQAPFTGALEGIGAPKEVLDINQFANDVINPATRGGRILVNMAENDVGGWEGLDQLLDVPMIGSYSRGTDQGAVDFGTRAVGDLLYDVAPELSAVAQPLGTAIGGIVGSYVPVIGTAAGAAIGSGIGSKIGAGNRTEDYGKDFINAGLAYGAGAATQGLSSAVSGSVGTPVGGFTDIASYVPSSGIAGATGSQAVGNVAGKVVEGAAKGAIGQAGNAYDQGSLTPVLVGAGAGALGGALSGSVGELYSGATSVDPSNNYYIDQAVGSNLGTISEMATGDKTTGTIGEFYNQGGAGFSELSGQTLPQFEVNPELKYAAWMNPVTDYTMGGAVNEPQYKTTITPQENPGEYKYDRPTFYDPDNPFGEPSLWDKTQSLMSNIGKSVLNSNLGRLGQQISADGQPYYVEGEEGRGGGSSSEALVDALMTRMAGAESAKKSKKAGYVEVLNPTTGLPILLKDVTGYREEEPEQKLYS